MEQAGQRQADADHHARQQVDAHDAGERRGVDEHLAAAELGELPHRGQVHELVAGEHEHRGERRRRDLGGARRAARRRRSRATRRAGSPTRGCVRPAPSGAASHDDARHGQGAEEAAQQVAHALGRELAVVAGARSRRGACPRPSRTAASRRSPRRPARRPRSEDGPVDLTPRIAGVRDLVMASIRSGRHVDPPDAQPQPGRRRRWPSTTATSGAGSTLQPGRRQERPSSSRTGSRPGSGTPIMRGLGVHASRPPARIPCPDRHREWRREVLDDRLPRGASSTITWNWLAEDQHADAREHPVDHRRAPRPGTSWPRLEEAGHQLDRRPAMQRRSQPRHLRDPCCLDELPDDHAQPGSRSADLQRGAPARTRPRPARRRSP